jgi:protein SON
VARRPGQPGQPRRLRRLHRRRPPDPRAGKSRPRRRPLGREFRRPCALRCSRAWGCTSPPRCSRPRPGTRPARRRRRRPRCTSLPSCTRHLRHRGCHPVRGCGNNRLRRGCTRRQCRGWSHRSRASSRRNRRRTRSSRRTCRDPDRRRRSRRAALRRCRGLPCTCPATRGTRPAAGRTRRSRTDRRRRGLSSRHSQSPRSRRRCWSRGRTPRRRSRSRRIAAR